MSSSGALELSPYAVATDMVTDEELEALREVRRAEWARAREALALNRLRGEVEQLERAYNAPADGPPRAITARAMRAVRPEERTGTS